MIFLDFTQLDKKFICFPYISNSHNSGSIGPNHIILVTTGLKMSYLVICVMYFYDISQYDGVSALSNNSFPYTSNSHNSGSIGPNHIILVTTGLKMSYLVICGMYFYDISQYDGVSILFT